MSEAGERAITREAVLARAKAGVASLWALLDDALVVAAVGVAAMSFSPAFTDPSWRTPVLGAVAIGACLGFVCGWARWPFPVAALVAVAGVFVTSAWMLGAAHGVPGPADLMATADRLIGGLARLLTVTPPADVTGELVAWPFALAWLAGFAAAALTFRRSVLAPLLPPILLLVAGLLLTAYYAPTRWGLTAAVLAVTLLALLLRSDIRDASIPDHAVRAATPESSAEAHGGGWLHSRAGRVLAGLPVVAVVAVAGVLGAVVVPVASGASRFDVRDLHDQPIVVQHRVNPLSDVRRQVEMRRPQRLFRATLAAGDLPVDRIRIAVLDQYDGSAWTSNGTYLPTGSVLPASVRIASPRVARLEIEMLAPADSFLPSAGTPLRVDGSDLAYDAASGQLISTAESAGGQRYALDFAVTAGPGTLGPLSKPAIGADALPYLHVPPEPPLDPEAPQQERFSELAQRLTAGARTPAKALEAVDDYLRHQPYDLRSPPGHSYAALRRVLAGTPPSEQGVTEEQTAAAFALMARLLGYPARIAVGYQLDQKDVAAKTFVVTTQRAYAWPEVLFNDIGWVAFDPTGQRRRTPPPPERQQSPGEGAQVPQTEAPTVQEQGPGDQGPEGQFGGGFRGRLVLWALLLSSAVALAIGGIIGAKAWRRQRRRTLGSTSERITSAWQESTDRLREYGVPAPLAATADEVADQTLDRLGPGAGATTAQLAPLMTAAVFAPDEPEDEDAETAWDLEGELRSILSGQQPWWERLRALLDPRPLLPRRRPVPGDQAWHPDGDGGAGR